MKQMILRAAIFSAILFFSQFLIAQNLTGIWRGYFYSPADIAMGGSRYRYEVQIENKGRETKGVTYSYQTTRFYGKASLVGVWSPDSKNLVINEDRMLELKIEGGGDGCLMTCYLTYRKEDGKEYLEGSYTSYNMNNKERGCGGGKVLLEKVPDTDFELEDFLVKKSSPANSTGKVKPGQEAYLVKKPATESTKATTQTKPPATAQTKPPASSQSKPPAATTKPPTTKPAPSGSTAKAQPAKPSPKPQESAPKPKQEPEKEVAKAKPEPAKPLPVMPPPPPVLKERKNELFKTITTSERFIEISFFDNGEIDGDTISVYNNNRLIASKKGLTAKAVTIRIELSENEPMQDVVMVAENLGSIPPNTALMIVKAGNQRYTLNLTSTEQKNAMVRFKYQPE
jgi:hypothetical protein